MKNSTLETESNDTELIAYVLEQLYAASHRTERVLETLDRMISDSKDIDTTKP